MVNSNRAIQKKRLDSRGLCFFSDEKFMPGQCFASQTLQVLPVDERDNKGSMGDLDDESHEHPHLDRVEVSLNSVVGSNHTTKIVSEIGSSKVILLIDSGATHNFCQLRL